MAKTAVVASIKTPSQIRTGLPFKSGKTTAKVSPTMVSIERPTIQPNELVKVGFWVLFKSIFTLSLVLKVSIARKVLTTRQPLSDAMIGRKGCWRREKVGCRLGDRKDRYPLHLHRYPPDVSRPDHLAEVPSAWAVATTGARR